jgi:hypothetical protein
MTHATAALSRADVQRLIDGFRHSGCRRLSLALGADRVQLSVPLKLAPGAEVACALSPAVGVFRSGTAAVGDAVSAETEVGAIETVLGRTPVYAGQAGTLATLCATDGDFVEYGAKLARVRPRGGAA